MDPLKLLEKASSWAAKKVEGAKDDLDAQTPCDEWKVRDLINHMLESNEYFKGSANGEDVSPPQGHPNDVMSDDPSADYEQSAKETMKAFGGNGKNAQSVGIAFVEQLVHGWDLAKATGQDAKMPKELAEAAWQMIGGRMTDEQRGTFFGPEVKVPDGASAQEKLLGYAGRQP
jgi:uncharacterized protein (TIGR03086 family)